MIEAMNDKGTYVLVLRVLDDIEITVGKLGALEFSKGFYAYAGSALGTGGFRRVTRHFNVACGKNRTRKWHIDHLLPVSEPECAVLMPGDNNLECRIADGLGTSLKHIPGFGCTDCSCSSHLFFSPADIRKDVLNICKDVTGIESIIIRPDI